MGMCGYLALEWASRVGFEADPVGLSLREAGAAEQLAEFVDRIAVDTEGRVRDKLDRVVSHLRGSLSPWLAPRSGGLWLGVADLPSLSLWFPLVLWGGDVGGGWRRVCYPSGQAAAVGTSRELASVAAQIVLDSDHFHPLDEAFGSIGPLCVAAARTDAERIALGPADRVGEELAGVDPAKRGAAFLGVVEGVSEAAVGINAAQGYERIQDQEPQTEGQPWLGVLPAGTLLGDKTRAAAWCSRGLVGFPAPSQNHQTRMGWC